MKQFLLVLSSSLLLTGSAVAQVGLRVGGSLSRFSTPTSLLGAAEVHSRARLGYAVGVYYQVALTPRLSLVPELQFSREYQRVTETSSPSLADASYQSTYRLSWSYLNLPLVVRATWGPVYLEAGPQVSLLVGGRGVGQTESYSWGGRASRYEIDQAATDRYHRLDAGFCLGVGVKLPAGLGLSLRAYQGLRSLDPAHTYDSGTPIPYSGNKTYRRSLQAALTYQLAAR